MSVPKLIVEIDKDMLEEIRQYILQYDKEIQGFGLIKSVRIKDEYMVRHKLVIEELLPLPMEQFMRNSGTGTEVEMGEMVEYVNKHVAKEDVSRVGFWWHSHVNMATYFSPTDYANAEGWKLSQNLVSLVLNKKGDHYIRFDTFTPHRIGTTDVELHVIGENPIAIRCKEVLDKKIKEASELYKRLNPEPENVAIHTAGPRYYGNRYYDNEGRRDPGKNWWPDDFEDDSNMYDYVPNTCQETKVGNFKDVREAAHFASTFEDINPDIELVSGILKFSGIKLPGKKHKSYPLYEENVEEWGEGIFQCNCTIKCLFRGDVGIETSMNECLIVMLSTCKIKFVSKDSSFNYKEEGVIAYLEGRLESKLLPSLFTRMEYLILSLLLECDLETWLEPYTMDKDSTIETDHDIVVANAVFNEQYREDTFGSTEDLGINIGHAEEGLKL